MKHIKNVLSLLMAGSMVFLAACGGGGGNGNDKKNADGEAGGGRYVETDVTPPIEGRFTSFLAADGTVVCFDAGLKNRYESTDGGASWSRRDGPGSGGERYQNVQAGALLADGGLLVYLQGEGLIEITRDGNEKPWPVEEIDKAVAEGQNVSVSLLQILGDSRLLLGYTVGGMMIQNRTAQGGMPGTQTDDPSADQPGDSADGAQDPAVTPQGGGQLGPGGNGRQNNDQNGGNAGMNIGAITSKTVLLDLSSKALVAELKADNTVAAAQSSNAAFYLLDSSGNASAYNISDGAPASDPNISFSGQASAGNEMGFMVSLQGESGGILSSSADGGLYSDQDGSLLYADKGGSIRTVLESTAYSVGAPRSTVSSVLALENGDILVNMLENSQANHLYKYVWDENAKINPDRTLTVWSLEDNNLVRAAIAELNKKYPDAYISYEVAMAGDNAISAADAIKSLNTRLLNGSGPDVLLLDGCPVDSYSGKGMLLDLSALLDTGDIYDNLLAPYIQDGKIYCLPTQFLLSVLMGSAEGLANVQSLDALVSLTVNGNDLPAGGGMGPGMITGIAEEDRAELYFDSLKELCEVIWMASAPAVISDNQVNADALRGYLAAVKAISDKYGLTEQLGVQGGLRVGFSDGGISTSLSGSLIRYVSQTTNYGAFTFGNLSFLQMLSFREGAELELFPGLTDGAWRPNCVTGVSADTKAPAFAAELIQTMLSLEVQRLNYGTGLPVTKSGMAGQVDDINERFSQTGQDTFSYDTDALVAQLTTPSTEDTVLTDMMWDSVERCCKGSTDVEGAVKEIEQNIKNYLSERS